MKRAIRKSSETARTVALGANEVLENSNAQIASEK